MSDKVRSYIPYGASFDVSHVEAELKRMRAAGEVHFTNGKWWRPTR